MFVQAPPLFSTTALSTPTKTVTLSVQQVKKSFAGNKSIVHVLDDVSFDVARGEFLCLLGPSGCGKSTLLSLIAGLDPDYQGRILDGDKEVRGPSTDRVVIFQDPTLFPWLDVIENIAFGLAMQHKPKREREALAARYLRMVHLARFEHAAVHELSGGMKQRVALARALAVDPAVLLMDEPFAALDAQTRDLLHVELEEIWASTLKTIVFVTHNVREAVRLGDRVLVMSARPGRILREFRIDLPRPRSMEDHALVEYTRAISAELRTEVDRVLAAERGFWKRGGV
jgi:NitT/TauT family transport system ATP-binding protein